MHVTSQSMPFNYIICGNRVNNVFCFFLIKCYHFEKLNQQFLTEHIEIL